MVKSVFGFTILSAMVHLFLPQCKAGATLQTLQSESLDCDQLETTTAATADHNPDCDTPPDELSPDVNSLARANSSTADTDAEQAAAARETADTPQAQTATAIAADNKTDCDKLDELDVNTLAKAS